MSEIVRIAVAEFLIEIVKVILAVAGFLGGSFLVVLLLSWKPWK